MKTSFHENTQSRSLCISLPAVAKMAVKCTASAFLTDAYAGGLIGLDQINAHIPHSLIGRGEVNVVVLVDGQAANALRVAIR